MKKKTALISSLCVGVLACVIGGSVGFRTHSETVIANAQVVDGFTILEQAAVRRSEPNGIRFTVNLTDSAYSEIGASATYGTLMIPADLLAEGEELTFETSQVLDVPTTNWQEVGERYTSALVGKDSNGDGEYDSLGEAYYNRPIVARGYAKMGDTVYYTENSAIRSIGYIATMAQVVDSDSSQLITDIVNKTDVEFVLNEEGKIAAGTADNTGLLYNTLDNSSDAVAAIKVGGITVPAQYVNIQYSVGDSGIATVNGQTITAVSTGTTSLTATCTFNGKEYTLNTTLSTESFVGASDYQILLSVNATAVETASADRLQSVVKEATGVVLPIVTETGNETTADKYISVGATSLATKNNVIVNSAKATATAWKTNGNTLFVVGNGDEGISYGVDELLGELVDYEYYAKNTYSYASPTATVTLPTDTTFEPDIEYNYAGNAYLNQGANDDLRQGLRMDRWYEDMIRFEDDFIHNSLTILDPATYQSSYSKWYVMDKQWDWSKFGYVYTPMELCYTAQGDSTAYNAMVSTAATKVFDGFMAEPTKTKASFSIMDTVFNNNTSWACTCSACKSKGNNSDTVISFLSDLCAAVETKLTNAGDSRANSFKIITLAYHQTYLAPKNVTDMNEHIEVWYAPIEATYTKPFDDTSDSFNVVALENLEGWATLLNKTENDLLLWMYSSNAYCLFAPYNSFASMRANYGIAADNGVDFMYDLGSNAQSGWTALKVYLDHELTWNANPTDAEWNGWIDGFFVAAYGDGATEMRNWFNDFLAMDTSIYDSVSGNVSILKQDVASSKYFSKTTLEKWLNYSSAALAALDVSDPNYNVYYDNIVLETLSPLYLMLEIYGDELDDVTQFNYASAFVAGVEDLGVSHVKETVSVEETLNELKSNMATEAELVFDVDESLALDADKVNKIFGEEKEVSSVTYGSSELYNNGTLAIGKSGIYNVIVTATDGTQKRVKLHVADEIIETAAEMDAVLYKGTETSGYYVLGNDIDYTGAEHTAYTAGNNGNGFTGIFDGMGYTIRNYSQPNAGANYALFGKLNGATVRNVNFENVTINAWWNSSLFAVYMFNSTVEDVTMRNVAFTVTTTEGPNGGLLVGSFVQNSVFRNVDIYMGSANNGHVNALLGAGAYGIEPTTFDDVNVYNVGELNLIVRINANNAAVYSAYEGLMIYADEGATEYEFVTIVETVEEEFIAENGTVTLKHTCFEVGKEYKIGGTSYTATTAGQLTVTISPLTIGVTNEVLVTYENDELSYREGVKFKVFAVTQVINNAAEMEAVLYKGTQISGYYVLGNDIDYTGATYTQYTAGNNGNGFTGIFDGRNYTIRNYAQPNAGANYALFGKLNGATVRNVNFENVTINAWWNSSLFAIYTFSSTIENITMRNVAFTVTATEGPDGGLLCGYYTDNSVFRNVDIYMSSTNNGFVGALLGAGGNTSAATLEDVNVYNVKQDQLQYIVRGQDNLANYAKFTGLTIYTDEGTTKYKFITAETVADEFIAESGKVTLKSNRFAAGETYTVEGNEYTVVTAGELEVTVNSLVVGSTNSISALGESYEITFTNVFAVTQVINNVAEMDSVLYKGTEISGYYILGNDIDYTGATYTQYTAGNGGNGFTGIFDGKNYTIRNYAQPNAGAFYALFGKLNGATVRNVNFENVTVNAWNNSGLFAVYMFNATVENVTMRNVAFTVTATAGPNGGLLCGFWTDNSVFRNVDIYMSSTNNGFVGALLGEGGNTTAATLEDVNVYNVKQDQLQYIVRGQDNLASYTKFTGLTIYTDEGTTEYPFKVWAEKTFNVSLGNNANADGLKLTFTNTSDATDVQTATVANGAATLTVLMDAEYAVTSEIFGAPIGFGTVAIGEEVDYSLAVSGLYNNNNANAAFNAADMSLSYTGNASGSQFFVQNQAIKGEYWFGFKFQRNATAGTLSTFMFISGSDISAYVYFVSVNGQLALRLATNENGWTEYGSYQYPSINNPYVFVQRHNNGGKLAYTVYMSAVPSLDGAWSYTYTTSVDYSADSAIGQFGFNAEADYVEGVVFSKIYSASAQEKLLAYYDKDGIYKNVSVSLGNNANSNGLVLTFTNIADASDVRTATVDGGSAKLKTTIGDEGKTFTVTSEIFGAPISLGTVTISSAADYSLTVSGLYNNNNANATFNAADMSLTYTGNASGSQFFVQNQAIKGEYWFSFKFQRNATAGTLSTFLFISGSDTNAYVYFVSVNGQLALRMATSENGWTEYGSFQYPSINDPYVFVQRHNNGGKLALTIYMSATPTLDGAWSYTYTTNVDYSADSAIGQFGFNAEADYAEGVVFSNIYSAASKEELLAKYN